MIRQASLERMVYVGLSAASNTGGEAAANSSGSRLSANRPVRVLDDLITLC